MGTEEIENLSHLGFDSKGLSASLYRLDKDAVDAIRRRWEKGICGGGENKMAKKLMSNREMALFRLCIALLSGECGYMAFQGRREAVRWIEKHIPYEYDEDDIEECLEEITGN